MAPNGFSTASHARKAKRRDARVDKMLARFNAKVTPIATVVGQVRGRSTDPASGIFDSFSLSNGAVKLEQVHG
jgi:hypothetical protein